MAYVPVSRAGALPSRGISVEQSARWSALASHARARSGHASHLVVRGDEVVVHTWGETARVVEAAAAGLVRSGLRVDQVVLSLLPAGHPWPELELALRTIGAVVVHVAPDAPSEELERELVGADVRLVVVEGADDLARLSHLSFASAELFALDDGRGWDRLLRLGEERLRMDPDAVLRVDRSVDPAGAVPRVLGRGRRLGRVVDTGLPDAVLGPDDVVLLEPDPADPWAHRVRDAHLAVGATLCELPPGADVLAALVRVRATVLVLSPASTRAVVDALDVRPAARPRRALRRTPAADPRSPLADHLRLLATEALDAHAREVLVAAGIEVLELGDARLSPPDLPVPPAVVLGDAADLPRRARHEPDQDFRLAVDREPLLVEVAEPDESAFVLPSLPLFGGESFLDKLLVQRAREARQ